MISAGIDPGKTGAYAILNTYQKPARLEVFGFKHLASGDLDVGQIARTLMDNSVEAAVIENVHAMPRQGVSSTFKFGDNFGQLKGMLNLLPIGWIKVDPQVWKRHLGLTGKGKEGSRAGAKELFPDCAKQLTSHDKCEAALLAWWVWKSRVASGEKPQQGQSILTIDKPGLIIPGN